MKRSLLTLSFLIAATLCVQAQMEIGEDFFHHMRKDALILSANGMLRGDEKVAEFIEGFTGKNGAVKSYTKDFDIEVNAILDFEIGELETDSGAFKVMFLKRKDDPAAAKIEFLTIYADEDSADKSDEITQQREAWMKYCNAHQAAKLVAELYTSNAWYYNRGRLLQGTMAITAEYGYMNSSNYSLTLTPKHLSFVNENIAYEIGRCSGSYPLPYMLLWQKQADGSWQVLMDSNF